MTIRTRATGWEAPLAVKQALRQGMAALALPTGPLRMLPEFVILGAQRAGTTSLYFYLAEHPCVAPGVLTKEVHFFDINFGKGVAWYRTHFPTLFRKQYVKLRHGFDLVTGEGTPYYLFHPHVPYRMAPILPNAKLIVMLRNPVDRAYSHYRHEVALGFERLSFEEALDRETERLQDEIEKIRENPSYQSFSHQHWTYQARGLYLDQLEVWHSIYPREQMLILNTEEFFSDPREGLRSVSRFLGLPEWSPVEFPKLNAHRAGPGLEERIRRRLQEHFHEPNDRLFEYLGVDFGWNE